MTKGDKIALLEQLKCELYEKRAHFIGRISREEANKEESQTWLKINSEKPATNNAKQTFLAGVLSDIDTNPDPDTTLIFKLSSTLEREAVDPTDVAFTKAQIKENEKQIKLSQKRIAKIDDMLVKIQTKIDNLNT